MPFLLRDTLAVAEFVNADRIAQGLSGFRPATVAIEAGRLPLARLDELARRHKSFAFETTLASRSFAPRLRARRANGYAITLCSFAADPEVAVRRVAERVARGGHQLLPGIVRRRCAAGRRNFFRLTSRSARPGGSTAPLSSTRRTCSPREHGTLASVVADRVAWDGIVRQWAQA